MNTLQYEVIYGQVVGKTSHYQAVADQDGTLSIVKDDVIRRYERTFAEQCHIYAGIYLNSRFRLHIRVFHSSNAYDLDNSIKTVLDCLQQVMAIADDNLCVSIIAEKHIDKRHPRVEFAIKPIYERGLVFDTQGYNFI